MLRHAKLLAPIRSTQPDHLHSYDRVVLPGQVHTSALVLWRICQLALINFTYCIAGRDRSIGANPPARSGKFFTISAGRPAVWHVLIFLLIWLAQSASFHDSRYANAAISASNDVCPSQNPKHSWSFFNSS